MADVTYRFYSEATLGGEKKTIEHSGTVSGVTQVFDQMVPLTTTKQTVLTWNNSNEAGATLTDWTMLVLENLDDSDAIDIAFEDSADASHFWLSLPAGRFFVLWNRSTEINDGATATATPGTYGTLELIVARAATNTANLRIVAYDDT